MALAFLEVLVEPLFKVVVWLLTAVVGLAIAELAYSLWLGVRWVIASDRGAHVLKDLHGAAWSVRSTWRPWPSQWPLSKKLFGLRRRAPSEGGRSEQHWLHPTQMADRFDDALFLVAPFVVVVLLVLVAVFIIETVIVVLLVSVAASWRFVSRRSWRVQVAGPDGTVTTRAGLSFGEATTIAERIKSTLRSSGSPDVEQAMSRRL